MGCIDPLAAIGRFASGEQERNPPVGGTTQTHLPVWSRKRDMRQLRRLFTAILVLLGAITIVPVFSGLASAHHSNIEASVACDGTVSWTAKSWSTGAEGTNTDIRVTKTVGTTTTQVGQGAFNNANNYQFSGTFAWPAGATSITVTSTPYATWGNGVVSNVGSSVTVTKPTNCPGQPGVSKAVSCSNTSPGHGDGTIVLTLTNNAGGFASSVSFNVYNPDQLSTFSTYSVAAGQTKQVTFSGLADGSHSVKITSGATDLSQTFAIDCDSPIPATSQDGHLRQRRWASRGDLEQHRRRGRGVRCHQPEDQHGRARHGQCRQLDDPHVLRFRRRRLHRDHQGRRGRLLAVVHCRLRSPVAQGLEHGRVRYEPRRCRHDHPRQRGHRRRSSSTSPTRPPTSSRT